MLNHDGQNAALRLGFIEDAGDRAAAAAELVGTPGFDVDAAVAWLHTAWHGDNPVECRRAREALEAVKGQ